MSKIILEVAVETIEDAIAAAEGGADRIELCAALDLGGLTPSLGTFELVRKVINLPIVVMIRPRAGDFVYNEWEISAMKRDIGHFVALKPDGFVFGILSPDAFVHHDACRVLIDQAMGIDCIFHRAFDKTNDSRRALEDCISLKFTRILSSGKAPDAVAGSQNLAKLQNLSHGRIGILPCGKVRAANVAEIHRMMNCKEVHGSFAVPYAEADTPGQRGYVRRSHTSREAVAECRAKLNEIENQMKSTDQNGTFLMPQS